MNTKIFRIGTSDLWKGAITAFFTGIIVALFQFISMDNFSLFSTDWIKLLDVSLSTGVVTFLGYIVKNFLSTEDGKVFGKIG